MNGSAFYQNGVSLASTPSNNASYIAMENLTTDVHIGGMADLDSPLWFNGYLYGGVCGPWFTQIQLTALQIAQITAIQLDALKGFDLNYRRLGRR